jgi:D-lactate dehydrogenase
MKIAFFGAKNYDKRSFDEANRAGQHTIHYIEPRLTTQTAALAAGYPAVCLFVNDNAGRAELEKLAAGGTRLLALRCAGFNQVDLKAAQALGVKVVRVPAYSPYAVAEHAVAMTLALNRKIHRAYNRVREGNFELDGLLGFDMRGRTVGIVGTGKIGEIAARIFKGFDCRILAYDITPNPALKGVAEYVGLDALYAQADIISLHCPLTPQTRFMINDAALTKMKDGVMIINTSRGPLVDTPAAIDALKTKKVGALALDVYEEEAELFFEDRSGRTLMDDVFARLLTFPNVLITGHQAFFTQEALHNIAETTLSNITDVEAGRPCPNEVVG